MTFSRTNSGLSNSAAFHDVDYLIYSEGGEYDAQLQCSRWAIDMVFWGSIFSRFFPNLKYKIRPMGSKENILPFAHKVRAAEITRSIVVMDRDHDYHRNCIVEHPCVIYTYGYSWENDAWRAEVLISKLNKLSPDGSVSNELANDIRNKCRNFFKDFNRLVYIDVLCSLSRVQGVDRERYWAFVDERDASRYKVKKDRFKKMISDIKSKRVEPFHFVGEYEIDSERDCYGKLLSRFLYQVFTESYKSVTGLKNLGKLDADVMIASHVEYFDLSTEPRIQKYYAGASQKLSNFLQL